MTAVNFIFGDLLTGQVIQEISLQGVSLVEELDGGELRGTLHLDQSGKLNEDLVAATIPGRCFVVAERLGKPIWDGIVWTRTYQSQAKSVQLYCRNYKAYPERRFIEEDKTYAGDQISVFLEMYEDMQADPNSIVIELPDAFTSGISVNVEVQASENKTYRQVINSFADAVTGFDWLVRTSKQGGSYVRRIEIGYPTIGTPLSSNSVTFDYPGNVTNYWKNESMGDSGTHFVSVGSGNGDASIISKTQDNSLLGNGFPRYDIDIPSKDISDQGLLDNLVAQEAENRRAPMPVFTIEVKADSTPMFGDYELGDYCRLSINDPMHPELFEAEKRLLSQDYYPSSDDNVEMARLRFEGDVSE